MDVKELTRDQLNALKERMTDEEIYEIEGRGASYGELAESHETVSDETVFARYAGTSFVPGDFP